MIFEIIAKVVLAQPSDELPEASSPESFGFIITVNGESFSSAVVPTDSDHLVPGQPTEIRLKFLTPETASKAINKADHKG